MRKTVLGSHLTIFQGKETSWAKNYVTFLSQMRYRIFYYLVVFSKKAVIFRETGKNPFLGTSFEEKEASVDENIYNLFYKK